jgi:hypothetical protein
VAAGGIAGLTAATWFAFTWERVFGYLVGYGYGIRALEYGDAIPFFSAAVLQRATKLITAAVFLPHFVLIAAGLAAGLFVFYRLANQHGWSAVRRVANSRVLVLATTVFCGLSALMSSPNTGTAFLAPLLPPLVGLAVCAAWAVASAPLYRVTVTWLSLTVAFLVALPFLGIYTLLPRLDFVVLPFIGPTTISDNRGTIDFAIEGSSANPIGKDKAGAALWNDAIARTNAAISRQRDNDSTIAVGFRNAFCHPTLMVLDFLIKTGRLRDFQPPDPIASGNTAKGYREWLTTGAAAHADLLMTSPGSDGEPLPPPPVDAEAMEEAARSLGFQPVDTWSTPNGRMITLWKRSL